VVRACHDRAPAGFLHAGRDWLRIGGNHDRSDRRGLRPAHDVNDLGSPANVASGLPEA